KGPTDAGVQVAVTMFGTFIPTCTVDILRGETTDGYGDPVDADTAVATGMLASIIETSRRIFLPAESRTTHVRMFTGRVAPGVDVREGDRLRDNAAQSIYLVEAVSRPSSPFG